MKGTDESSVALMSVKEFIIFFSEHIHGKGEGHGLRALEVGGKSRHHLLGWDEGNSAPGHLVGAPREEWTSDPPRAAPAVMLTLRAMPSLHHPESSLTRPLLPWQFPRVPEKDLQGIHWRFLSSVHVLAKKVFAVTAGYISFRLVSHGFQDCPLCKANQSSDFREYFLPARFCSPESLC